MLVGFFMPCTFLSFHIFMSVSGLILLSCLLFVFHVLFMTVWTTNNFAMTGLFLASPLVIHTSLGCCLLWMLTPCCFSAVPCVPGSSWIISISLSQGTSQLGIHFPTHFHSILVLLVNFWAHALNHPASGCSAGNMFTSNPDGLGYPTLLQISSFFCTAISECSEPTCLLSS